MKLATAITHIRLRFFLVLANTVSAILPPTRLFSIRVSLYRKAGLKVGSGTKIVGGTKFHFANVSLGDQTWIGTESHFFANPSTFIEIGSRVDIGPGCYFVTGSHAMGDHNRRAGKSMSGSIVIGDGTWIASRVTCLDGTIIGKGCIVAAGAVVRGTFPDNVLIGGVPARVIRQLES